MDYREIDPPDDRFLELVRYAFAPQEGPFDPEEFDPEDRPKPVNAQRGLFDGDEAVAVCAHYWFDVDVRGAMVSAPGLSAVASPPEHRRGGNVRQLLRESLVEYRERGDSLSLLWPFSAPFYGQYGWATTNRYVVHEIEPGDLAFATDTDAAAAVEFEQVDADDWETLHAVDRETWTQTLALDRSEDFWRHRVFESWGTDPYVYVGYRNGDPVAYVAYTMEMEDDERKLSASYFGAVDHDAVLALLSFCHAHDSQVSAVRLKAPVEFELEYALVDPGSADTELRSGPMARVVDAVDALEAVPVENVDCDVVLAIDDPIVDWHDDPIRLAVSGGDPTAERAPDATPDVSLGPGELAQVLLGTRTASDLARTGDLHSPDGDALEPVADAVAPDADAVAPDADAVAALDAAYPETDACMLQFF